MSELEVYRPSLITVRDTARPPRDAPQHVIDDWLPPSAQELIIRGNATNTLRAYVQALRWYRSWCADERRTWLPSTQNTMVAYLDAWRTKPIHVGCLCREHRPSPSAAWIWYSAIRWAHGIGDPPVPWEGGLRLAKAMKRYGEEMTEGGWKRQKAPRAHPQHITAMVDAVDGASELVLAPARRDMIRALVLAGYYTGGRASDASTYRIGDIDYFPGGIDLTLTMSKANKNAGRKEEHRTIHRDLENPKYDGVQAIDVWVARLRETGVTAGALFRPVHKSGTIVRGTPDGMGYRMDVTGLTRTVRLAAKLAQLPHWEKFTFHSLRRGRVMRLRELGADTWDIENELGWAHGGAVTEYFEEVKRQSPDAVNALGML